MEPELRLDKTDLFQALESDLLQRFTVLDREPGSTELAL